MAAINHCNNKDRPIRLRKKDGVEMKSMRYSKALGQYVVIHDILELNDYQYLHNLQAAMLRGHLQLPPGKERHARVLPMDHPNRIQATIAPIPRPKMEDMERKSRTRKD